MCAPGQYINRIRVIVQQCGIDEVVKEVIVAASVIGLILFPANVLEWDTIMVRIGGNLGM